MLISYNYKVMKSYFFDLNPFYKEIAMAIAEDRLTTKSLVKLDKIDYASFVDSLDVKSLSEMSSLATDFLGDIDGYVNNLFNNPILGAIHNLINEAIGIFENVICCEYPSLSVRLPSYKTSLNRNLNMSWNISICGKSKTINPIDTILSAIGFVQSNPGILSGDKDAILRAVLTSDLVRKMNILGLGTVIPDCILDKTGASLSSYYSTRGTGASLSTRRRLANLINKDKCARLVASQVGLFGALESYNNSHLINMILEGDPTKGSTYFYALLGMDQYRINNLMGYSQSFTYTYSYQQTYTKLAVFSQAKSAGLITDKDKAYMSGKASDVLDALSQDETKDKKLDVVLDTLDMIDPTWNKDDLGNTNLSVTKDNETMYELAKQKLQSSNDATISIDITYEDIITSDPTDLRVTEANPKKVNVNKVFNNEIEAAGYICNLEGMEITADNLVSVVMKLRLGRGRTSVLVLGKYTVIYKEYLDLDGVYETVLNTEHHIAIINSFAS